MMAALEEVAVISGWSLPRSSALGIRGVAQGLKAGNRVGNTVMGRLFSCHGTSALGWSMEVKAVRRAAPTSTHSLTVSTGDLCTSENTGAEVDLVPLSVQPLKALRVNNRRVVY